MIALTEDGILHHHAQLGSYSAVKLLEFLNELNIIVDDTLHTIITDGFIKLLILSNGSTTLFTAVDTCHHTVHF